MAKSYLYRVILPLMIAAGILQWTVAYISYLQTQNARLTADEAARVERVHLALQELRSALAEAESARRGNLISSNTVHLESFRDSIAAGRAALTRLETLIKDPQQREHLGVLEPLVESKLQHMAALDLSAAQRMSSLDEGRRLMGKVRDQISQMDARQVAIAARLRVQSELSQARVKTTVIWGNVLSFLLVVTALVLVERESQRRFRAEADLRRNEEQYRNLVLNIPDVPWKTNAEGAPTYVGEGILKITGFTPQELIDGGAGFWRTRVHDDDLEAVNAGFTGLFGAGTPLDVEYRFHRKDGAWVWVYTRASVVSAEGGVRYTQGLVSDISARKASEEGNAKLTKALEESNRELELRNREVQRATLLKSRFLANMSHELRTPLNAIMGFSELLEDPNTGAVSDRQRRWLGHIRAGAGHLLQLINDILDISKIEADQLDFRPESFVLRDAILEAIAIVRPLAQSRRVNLAENVPEDIVVEVDRTRLKQIIYNLASNAVKFTPAHGLVRIEAQALSDFIRVSVRDTGVGIRAEDQEIIFEEFRQASDTNKGVPEGTGLGLAITKRLVERQGGRIWVESEAGKGSVFTFTLRKGTLEPTLRRSLPPAEKRENGRFSILIVDDEPVTRELLLSHLQAEGFQTVTARTAAQGREAARARRPDAIILDILLPDAEGWDLLHDLKQDPLTADIPVIVVSIIDRKERGFTLGASDYLTKPVARDALLKTLRQHLPTEPDAQILVVEDEPADREIICETLSSLGVRVRTADNGEDGLETLHNDDGRLRLVILDLMLPRMDGFEFLRRVKENRFLRQLPIVVLTGKDLTVAESDFLRAESHALFMKGDAWRDDFIRQVQKTLVHKQQPIPG